MGFVHSIEIQKLLILYGGWLEGLYLATESCREQAQISEVLIEQIGQQKIVIDNLLLLTETHATNPSIKPIRDDLETLKVLYDQVTISFTYAEPTKKVVNGMLVIEGNSESVINVAPELLPQILDAVAKIRNKKVVNV